MTLSQNMIDALKHACLLTNGQIACPVWDGRTRRGLLNRGAIQCLDARHVILRSWALVIAAVAAQDASDASRPTREYIERHLARDGQFDDDYSTDVTREAWKMVRRGELVARTGEVGGWGSRYPGWVFTRP